MTKILMVCLGNICRSPLAEGILSSKVDPETVFVDSAGTAGYHVGNLPDKRSIMVASKHGIDLTHQRCRKFSPKDFSTFDHIYVMDYSNYSNVISLAKTPEEKKKVSLLLDAIAIETKEVPDPYYGGTDGFEQVYQLIDMACEEIAKTIRNGGK